MLRAHTIRLNPTPEQEQHFRQAAGTARFCFNWGLRQIKAALDTGDVPRSARDLRNTFRQIRRDQFPWTLNAEDIYQPKRGYRPLLDAGPADAWQRSLFTLAVAWQNRCCTFDQAMAVCWFVYD